MIYDATIVIPLLRQRDDWLEQSVRSALAQSVPTEVIVVNSKMTTASNLQILDQLQRQHNNVTVLCEEKPSSFPNAINTGIRKAGAERIGLLLSDDWLDRSAVAECLPIPADIVATGHAVYFPDGRVNEAACMDASVTRFEALPTLEAKAS